MDRRHSRSIPVRTTTRTDDLDRIRRVLRFVQEHLDSELTPDECARVAHFSRYHFHRIFSGFVGESGCDGPRPAEPAARPADTSRRGNWQWQSRSQLRQPSLLLFDEGSRNRATRDAYGKTVAQAKQPVVPALTDIDQRQVCEVWVLLPEQGPNQRRIDHNFGWRCRADRHMVLSSSLAVIESGRDGCPSSTSYATRDRDVTLVPTFHAPDSKDTMMKTRTAARRVWHKRCAVSAETCGRSRSGYAPVQRLVQVASRGASTWRDRLVRMVGAAIRSFATAGQTSGHHDRGSVQRRLLGSEGLRGINRGRTPRRQ